MSAPEEDLVLRLRKRAEIRRAIPGRRSVQEGKPDRLADLLDEAAREIEQLRRTAMSLFAAVISTEPCAECGCVGATCDYCHHASGANVCGSCGCPKPKAAEAASSCCTCADNCDKCGKSLWTCIERGQIGQGLLSPVDPSKCDGKCQ